MSLASPRLNRLPASERGITIGDFLVPIAIGERISERARHLALVVLGAVLIALSANVALPLDGRSISFLGDVRVTLPISPVPITLQTFSVLLVGGALGFRRGGLSVGLYLLMGLFLPVYAGGASGIHTFVARDGGHLVLGATGGYLIGFLLASAIVGRLAELGWDRHVGGAVAAMLVGNLVIYLVGVPWLAVAAGFDPATALEKGAYPFLAWDLIKLAAAGIIFPTAWWIVGRGHGER